MQDKERRRSKRVNFRQPLEFELCAVRHADDHPGRTGLGTDISSDGIGLEAEDRLDEGELVKLNIPVGKDGTCIPVFAEVCWVARGERKFRVGLHFLS